MFSQGPVRSQAQLFQCRAEKVSSCSLVFVFEPRHGPSLSPTILLSGMFFLLEPVYIIAV